MENAKETVYIENYNPCIFENAFFVILLLLIVYLEYFWYEPYDWRWRSAMSAALFGFIFYTCYLIYRIIVKKFCKPIKTEISMMNGKLFIKDINKNKYEEIMYIEVINNPVFLLSPYIMYEDVRDYIKLFINISKLDAPTLYFLYIIIVLPIILIFLVIFLVLRAIIAVILSIIISTIKNKNVICKIYFFGEIESKGLLTESLKFSDKKHVLTFLTKEEKEKFKSFVLPYISIKEV